MDKEYILELYNNLGGESSFGKYSDFEKLITTDVQYQKDFHSSFGKETLGDFKDFSSLVQKKNSNSTGSQTPKVSQSIPQPKPSTSVGGKQPQVKPSATSSGGNKPINVVGRKGVRKNKDGTESTHLMAREYVDGKGWVVFPTLFQNTDGSWFDMSKIKEEKGFGDVYKEALKRGEVYEFGDDEKSAIDFADKGNWKNKNSNKTTSNESSDLINKFGLKPGEKIDGVERKAYEAQRNQPKLSVAKKQDIVETKSVSKGLDKKLDAKYEEISQIPVKQNKQFIQDFRNATAITPDYESQVRQEVQDELQGKGVWNTITQGASNLWNKVVPYIPGAPFDEKELEKLKSDVTFLPKAKEEYKNSLLKQGIKEEEITDDILTKGAIELEVNKRIEDKRLSLVNDYLDSISDEVKDSMELNTLREKDLKSPEVKRQYDILLTLDKDLEEDNSELLKLEKIAEEQGGLNEEQLNSYNSILYNVKNKIETRNKLYSSYEKNVSDLTTLEEEYDLFKRSYGFEDKAGKLLNAVADFGLGVSQFANMVQRGPTQDLIAMELAGIKNNKDKVVAEKLQKQVEDSENVNDILDYSADVLISQVPNIAMGYLTGGTSMLVGIGVSSTGNKYSELLQSNIEGKTDYSKLQLYLASGLYGGAEMLESNTLRMIGGGKRLISKALKNEPSRKLFKESLSTKTFNTGKEFLKNYKGELKEEFTTFGAQKLTDIVVLDMDSKDVFKNAKEEIKSITKDTGVMVVGLNLFPATMSKVINAFAPKDYTYNLDKNNKRIEELSKIINNKDASDLARKEAKESIDKIVKANEEELNKIIKNTSKLSDDLIDKVIELEIDSSNLRNKANEINNDKSLTKKEKESLLLGLKEKFIQNEILREDIITGRKKSFDILPEEESTKLKIKAAEELKAEAIEGGIEEDKVNIKEEDITKRAIENYEKQPKETTTEKPTEKGPTGQEGDKGVVTTQEQEGGVVQEEEVSLKNKEADIEKRRQKELDDLEFKFGGWAVQNSEVEAELMTGQDGKQVVTVALKSNTNTGYKNSPALSGRFDTRQEAKDFIEEVVKPKITEKINAKYDAELNNIKTEQDAIQEQSTSKVPVQSETAIGEEVEQGKSESKPESVTKEEIVPGSKSVVSGVEITYPTIEQETERKEARSKTEYVEEASKDLDVEDTTVMSKELDGEFGILTAENPMAKPLTEAENVALNKKAKQWLESRGYKPRRLTGKYAQAENSFFVPNLSKADAIAFAKEFNQDSVAHSEGLIYQDGSMNPRVKSDDDFSFSESYDSNSDNVSVVKTKDGLKTFSVGYNFNQKVGPNQNSVTISPTDINIDEKVEGTSNKRIAKIAVKAAKALYKVLPNVRIVLHNTNDSFVGISGESKNQSSSGLYQNGEIHINLEKANRRTVAHEVFHAILLDKVKTDSKAADVTKKMIEALTPMLDKNKALKQRLQDFADNYDDNIQNEEKIAEFVGILASNFDSLSGRAKEAIKNWLNSLAKMFGVEAFESNEVLDVLNTIAKSVATGKEISLSETDIFDTGSIVERPSDFLRKQKVGSFDVIYTEQEKIDKLVEDGLITEPEDTSFMSNEQVAITSPDDMLVGTISIDGKQIFEGGGGVFFVTKYGDVWASGKEGTANTLATAINNSLKNNKSGKGYLVLTKGSDSKLISSVSGVNSSLSVLETILDKGLISLSDFRKAVSESVKKEVFNISVNDQVKKYKKDNKLSKGDKIPAIAMQSIKEKAKKVSESSKGFIKLSSESKQLKSDIESYFSDPSTSTFETRGNVIKDLIGILSQSKSVKDNSKKIIDLLGGDSSKKLGKDKTKNSESLTDLIAGVASEKLTKGLNVGDVYAIIEVNGEVVVKEDSHPSYPFHVVQKDGKKPILHLPKLRENGSKTITTSSGKPYSVGQVSIMSGKFNDNATRQQKVKEESEYQRIAKVKLDKKEFNAIRASLRNTLPDSLTLEVLDAVAKGETLGYDYDMDLAIEDMIENGVSFNNIANILMQDEDFVDKKNITSKRRAIDYLIRVGDKGTLFKAAYRQQKSLPENVSKKLTETPDGKFIFKHFSDERRDVIKKGQGQNRITSTEESSALSSVGGIAMFYTMANQTESGVGNVEHTVLVDKNKVYDIDSDPMGFEAEARKRFNEVRPGQAFTNNYRGAFITKIANENGFDIAVSQWRGGELRAQTTLELKPEKTNTQFKERPLPTFSVGEVAIIDGKESVIEKIEGDRLTYKSVDGTASGVTLNNERNRRSIIKIEPSPVARKQRAFEKSRKAAIKNVKGGKYGSLTNTSKSNKVTILEHETMKVKLLNIAMLFPKIVEKVVDVDLFNKYKDVILSMSGRRLAAQTTITAQEVADLYDQIIDDYTNFSDVQNAISNGIDINTLPDEQKDYYENNEDKFDKPKVEREKDIEKSKEEREELENQVVSLVPSIKHTPKDYDTKSMSFKIASLLADINPLDLKLLSNSQLENLRRVLETMSLGEDIPAYANDVYQEILSNRNMALESNIADKYNRTGFNRIPLRRKLTEMTDAIRGFFGENALTKKSNLESRASRYPLVLIDTANKIFGVLPKYSDAVLNNYGAIPIYKYILSSIEKGEGALASRNEEVAEVFKKSYDRLSEKTKDIDESLRKIHFAFLQVQAWANPGNKKVKSGVVSFTENFKNPDTPYSDKMKKQYEKFVDKYKGYSFIKSNDKLVVLDENGVDVTTEYFSREEMVAYKTIRKELDNQKARAEETSLFNNKNALPFVNEYFPENNFSKTASAQSINDDPLSNNFSKKPSVKSKSLLEKTTQSHPVMHNPFAVSLISIKGTEMQYQLLNPIQVARKTLKKIKENNQKAIVESTGKEKARYNELGKVYDNIDGAIETLVEHLKGANIGKADALDNISDILTNTFYIGALASGIRTIPDLALNYQHLITAEPSALLEGLNQRKVVNRVVNKINKQNPDNVYRQILKYIEASQINRVMGVVNLTSVRSEFQSEGASSDIIRKGVESDASKVWNKVTGVFDPITSKGKLLNEALMSVSDNMPALSFFLGVFSSEFKDASGDNFDWEKAANNDSSYALDNAGAIEHASMIANFKLATYLGSKNVSSKSPVVVSAMRGQEGKILGKLKNRANYMFRQFQMSSTGQFLSALNTLFEVESRQDVSKQVRIMIGSGLRTSLYYAISQSIIKGIVGLILGDDEDEEIMRKNSNELSNDDEFIKKLYTLTESYKEFKKEVGESNPELDFDIAEVFNADGKLKGEILDLLKDKRFRDLFDANYRFYAREMFSLKITELSKDNGLMKDYKESNVKDIIKRIDSGDKNISQNQLEMRLAYLNSEYGRSAINQEDREDYIEKIEEYLVDTKYYLLYNRIASNDEFDNTTPEGSFKAAALFVTMDNLLKHRDNSFMSNWEKGIVETAINVTTGIRGSYPTQAVSYIVELINKKHKESTRGYYDFERDRYNYSTPDIMLSDKAFKPGKILESLTPPEITVLMQGFQRNKVTDVALIGLRMPGISDLNRISGGIKKDNIYENARGKFVENEIKQFLEKKLYLTEKEKEAKAKKDAEYKSKLVQDKDKIRRVTK